MKEPGLLILNVLSWLLFVAMSIHSYYWAYGYTFLGFLTVLYVTVFETRISSKLNLITFSKLLFELRQQELCNPVMKAHVYHKVQTSSPTDATDATDAAAATTCKTLH